jgi:hypothetical protein
LEICSESLCINIYTPVLRRLPPRLTFAHDESQLTLQRPHD